MNATRTEMTLREYYVERLRAERPAFLAVLKAIPPEKAPYKPHDRSPSAGQLVWTLTGELQACVDAATEHQAEWQSPPDIGIEEMIVKYERLSSELADIVASMDEDGWSSSAKFLYNGKVVSEQPIGQFLWFILFDAIHHRGQLSAYLRPMGSTVPAIYGPSADASPARS
jgi:uncharacterized damage-inducible protein DinB